MSLKTIKVEKNKKKFKKWQCLRIFFNICMYVFNFNFDYDYSIQNLFNIMLSGW